MADGRLITLLLLLFRQAKRTSKLPLTLVLVELEEGAQSTEFSHVVNKQHVDTSSSIATINAVSQSVAKNDSTVTTAQIPFAH